MFRIRQVQFQSKVLYSTLIMQFSLGKKRSKNQPPAEPVSNHFHQLALMHRTDKMGKNSTYPFSNSASLRNWPTILTFNR